MGDETKARDELKAKLALAREVKAKRDAERDDESLARELVILELEDKYEKELGKRGDAFEIVDAGAEGAIVLKRIDGGAVLYKRFQASMAGSKDPQPEDLDAYVRPCVVHPEKTRFGEIAERRPHLLLRCANALTTLFGAKEADTRSKH